MVSSKDTSELDRLLTLADFAELAHSRISPPAWARVAGGAADEISLGWNREAYDRIRLRPRVLVDVSQLDTRVALCGQELSFPILLSPTGAQSFVQEQGDLAVARAAAAAHALLIISSSASMPLEEVTAAATGPIWFQLYVQRDRAFTRDLVQRAEAAGCRAICVTVDSPSHGTRDREHRFQGQLPGRPLPNLPSKDYLDPSVTWKDIDWLLSFATTPVLLKGILDPDDAELAIEAGVDGIFVSNHGARNLDTVPATIDALPAVANRVAGRVPVLIDGGIRRGTDILKALALGATAVGIGRPYLYGLGVAGEEGVTRVVQILRREFELAMMLSGRPNLPSINRSVLWDWPAAPAGSSASRR
jgi:4-hydroxymandelate oxidase